MHKQVGPQYKQVIGLNKFYQLNYNLQVSLKFLGSFASFFIAVAGFLSHYLDKKTIILSGIVLSSVAVGLSALVDTIQSVIFLSAIQGNSIKDIFEQNS